MKLPVFNYSYIKNQQDNSILDVFIDGDIVDASTQEFYQMYWGDETSTSYKSFRNTILNSDASRINININSGGGMVADALAMHDFIKEQIANGRNIHTYGKGMVCSAATYPLLAGGADNTHISENCFFMIHNVSGTVGGDVNQVEAGARMMRKFNDCARDLYASYFDKPKETIANWMNSETWWTGNDMKDKGFIKKCGPAENVFTNSIPKEKWLFENAAILNSINSSIPKPKNKDMKKNSIVNAITEAFTKLGLTNDAKLTAVKVDELKNALTASLEAAADEDVDQAAIGSAVTNALSGEAFETAVTNAVKKFLNTVPENITEAITNATAGLAKTTDVVNKTELDAVKNDLATKLGTTRIKNTRNTKEEEMESMADTPGVSWNVSAE